MSAGNLISEEKIMDKNSLINKLKSSEFYAECPNCFREFKLSEAILFDGLVRVFPDTAEDKRKEMLAILKERADQLKKRKIYADVGAERRAIEIGVGKNIEKIIPAYKKFKIPLTDCRPLFDPIDYIVFKGMTKINVDWVTFLEIKTGESKLTKHERMI